MALTLLAMKLLASLPVEFLIPRHRAGQSSGHARRHRRHASFRVAAALVAALAAGMPAPATAQPGQAPASRAFPADTRVGVFEIIAYPDAAIDGKPARLAAGAQIRNRSNLIVLPTTVTGRVAVRYRLDPSGQLSRVWILTPAEIEAATAAQRP